MRDKNKVISTAFNWLDVLEIIIITFIYLYSYIFHYAVDQGYGSNGEFLVDWLAACLTGSLY